MPSHSFLVTNQSNMTIVRKLRNMARSIFLWSSTACAVSVSTCVSTLLPLLWELLKSVPVVMALPRAQMYQTCIAEVYWSAFTQSTCTLHLLPDVAVRLDRLVTLPLRKSKPMKGRRVEQASFVPRSLP